MAQGDAHIDLLHIAGRAVAEALAGLEVEMSRARGDDHAPGLLIHGGRGKAKHLKLQFQLSMNLQPNIFKTMRTLSNNMFRSSEQM